VNAPATSLAERLRPRRLEDIVGQEGLTGSDGVLTRIAAAGAPVSLILWGPPGSGKTSIAPLLADAFGARLVSLSAIFSGVADLKRCFADARTARDMGERTLLFVDEIHRFNRTQQDAFLPVIEDGSIALVGATTENPSFAINAALMSRCTLITLGALSDDALEALLQRAEAEFGTALPLTGEARAQLRLWADGDGRYLLNQAELIVLAAPPAPLDPQQMGALLQRRAPVYDRAGDGHYGLISALHKAMRGSDPDASLYWLARMLVAGEDPLYVLRRIVRFASEDVGLADPQALVQAMAAVEAYRLLGSPEGELAIVQACLYCATAPKSNAAYVAQKAAWRRAKESGSLQPPAHIINAPTKAMRAIGRGEGYRYDHDEPGAFSGQSYWPEALPRESYYHPTDRGFEHRIAERIAWWNDRRTR
jgi:putative ATPase